MNWGAAFNTSIGKKLIMAATGLFLIVFLVVHCYVNAQVFWFDDGEKFNLAAHFMGSNPVIRITEIGLFAGLIWHIIMGLRLWITNTKKRTTRYKVTARSETSKWYSRSMGILGSLILIFLAVHLTNFWAPNRYAQTFKGGELDLYSMMKEHFSNILMVILYVGGCIALSWHLLHGFWSSFQTFGLTTHRYKGIINSIGVAFSIIIPLVFALMPIAFYMGWV